MKEENVKSNLQEKMNLSEADELKIDGEPTMSREEALKKLQFDTEVE